MNAKEGYQRANHSTDWIAKQLRINTPLRISLLMIFAGLVLPAAAYQIAGVFDRLLGPLGSLASQEIQVKSGRVAGNAETYIQFGILVVTMVYAVFAGLPWRAIAEQARLARETLGQARKAAEAAANSADAAKRALLANRPYMIIPKAKLLRLRRDDFPEAFQEVSEILPVTAVLTFTNYGKGPALIDRILTSLEAVDALPRARDFSKCNEQEITKPVIVGSEQLEVTANVWLSDETRNEIVEFKHTLASGCDPTGGEPQESRVGRAH